MALHCNHVLKYNDTHIEVHSAVHCVEAWDRVYSVTQCYPLLPTVTHGSSIGTQIMTHFLELSLISCATAIRVYSVKVHVVQYNSTRIAVRWAEKGGG